MGVRKTADFLEKATWTLAISLVVLCLLSTITINRNQAAPKSAIEEKINNVADPNAGMNLPTNAPSTNQSPNKAAPAKEADKTKK
jgi:preprotein translocase subunit SecG